MVVRHTALTLSAKPASASRAIAGPIARTRPAAAIAAPQTMTAPITIRPSRWAWLIHPELSTARVAPAATAAYRAPVPEAPAWYTVSESTANRARGIPNVIATRSIAKLPARARFERTNRSPSAIEAIIGGCSAWTDGWGAIATAAANIARHDAASTR